MKKAAIAFGLGLVFSLHGLWASELEQLAVIAEAYTQLGDDNNYVDSAIMSADKFEHYKSKATIIPSSSDDKLIIAALAECVFMRKGAYGDHLSEELSERIVSGFYHTMRLGTNLLSSSILYRLDASAMELSSGIFGAPCIFAIQRENYVLVLQAAGMD